MMETNVLNQWKVINQNEALSEVSRIVISGTSHLPVVIMSELRNMVRVLN